MQWLFCVALPPFWRRQRELGRVSPCFIGYALILQRFMALGLPRDALPIFEGLELWNDLIDCLQMLQQVSTDALLSNPLGWSRRGACLAAPCCGSNPCVVVQQRAAYFLTHIGVCSVILSARKSTT
jgi:hypothetical protein